MKCLSPFGADIHRKEGVEQSLIFMGPFLGMYNAFGQKKRIKKYNQVSISQTLISQGTLLYKNRVELQWLEH